MCQVLFPRKSCHLWQEIKKKSFRNNLTFILSSCLHQYSKEAKMYPQPKIMILEVIFSSPFHTFTFCSLSKISSKSMFKLLLNGKHVYSFSILSMKQLIAFALTSRSSFQNLYFCCNVILLLFKMTFLCVYKCGTVHMCGWVCHSVHVWM